MSQPRNPQPVLSLALAPRPNIAVFNKVLARLAGRRGSSDRVAARAVCARRKRVFEDIQLFGCRSLHVPNMEQTSEHMAPKFRARGTS